MEEELLREAANPQYGLWWLSCVDPFIGLLIAPEDKRPGGDSFRGVVIVEADGPFSAIHKARELGIRFNGLEIRAWGPAPLGTWKAEYYNRLLSHEEAHLAEGLG